MKTIRGSWIRRLLALFAVLAPIQFATVPSTAWADEFDDPYEGSWDDVYVESEGASSGPGTRWRKCRNEAWADYNECLMERPDSTAHQTLCFFLWDLDNIGCDLELLNIFSFLWK